MAYPISLTELKQHLRIDSNNFDDDKYLEDIIIPTSVQYCNNYIDSSVFIDDSSCPYQVKQAILICAADLYDVERNSYTISNIKRGDIIQRLLLPYKTIEW